MPTVLPELTPELIEKYDRLRAVLADMGSVVIGMSGGVDSVLLAKVAQDVLDQRALAVTADSPSLPRRELREAAELAQMAGIRHLIVKTTEVSDPRYAANPNNRCYFCKTELFTRLDVLAAERGLDWVAYGENIDDLGDHRPGAQAAREHNVRAPLKEAGLPRPIFGHWQAILSYQYGTNQPLPALARVSRMAARSRPRNWPKLRQPKMHSGILGFASIAYATMVTWPALRSIQPICHA